MTYKLILHQLTHHFYRKTVNFYFYWRYMICVDITITYLYIYVKSYEGLPKIRPSFRGFVKGLVQK